MEEPVKEKPTWLLYLVPVFMSLLGGVLMYIAVKDQDQRMANNGMICGFISFMVQVVILFMMIWGSYIESLRLNSRPSLYTCQFRNLKP
jgi:uncharacterized membrane protein